jgi:3-isopropylmalate dehydrogenase
MTKRIVLLPGDGVGPEVVDSAHRVLREAASRFGFSLAFETHAIGGAAIDAYGAPLPDATLSACRAADAVLLGAVGGPKWSDVPVAIRPEQGLLKIRQALGLYANLRPVKPLPALAELSPLKPVRMRDVDLLVVRELTGGIYFGKRERGADFATDECRYTTAEIERVVRVAGRVARQRDKRIVSVDKANVLDTSRLWRDTTTRVIRDEFPEIKLEHVLVDAMAMYLISRPRDFDVIVTENLFGDILTDEAAVLAGSLGMLPSASIGDGTFGLYEPIHGSAPDIAGRGIANPIGTILSAAMLLRLSLGRAEAADAIERAVARAIDSGARTPDIADGGASVDTATMTDAVIAGMSALRSRVA